VTGDFKDHFSDRAARYATYRPHYPKALGDYLAGLAPRRGTAWDVGCGSGQMSTLLGDHFDRVIATDASAEQIARAEIHPHVEYAVASAEQSGIASGSVDLIVAAQAVHWFDLPRFYMEVRRVGRPDAMVALVAYGVTLMEPAVLPVVDHFYWEVLDQWWPPERKHIELDYREIAFPFAEVAPPEMTMSVNWTVDEFVGYVGTWSAVRAMEKAEGAAGYQFFVGELRSAWGSVVRRRVWWKVAMRVGRVGS
jgi:SAM-dependent methyltransferase